MNMMIREMKSASVLASLLLGGCFLVSSSAWANDANNQDIQVASLKVKERLQSMERINVTAEKAPVAVKPESAAVEALLREAEALDEENKQAQSPAH